MFLAVCNDPKVLEAALLGKTVIDLCKIIGPLCVVLFASIDILKAVTSKDESSIKKQQKMIPKRLLAMAIIFLVPTLVGVTMSLVDDTFEYTACFQNATAGNIKQLQLNIAREKVAEADALTKTSDWKAFQARNIVEDAKLAVLKINDSEDKAVLEKSILELEEKIRMKQAKEDLEKVEGPLLDLRDNAYKKPDGSSGNQTTQPGSGTLPYYNQCDEPWGSKTFYTGSYCRQSCGATSLAMVAAGIGNNSNAVPTTIGDKMKSMGLPATFNSHNAFTNSSFLATFGLKGTSLGTGCDKNSTLTKMATVLEQGKPVIINLPGHYVVVDHIQNGKYHMLDPGTRSYNKYYTADELWKEIWDYKGRTTSGESSPKCAYFYFERTS